MRPIRSLVIYIVVVFLGGALLAPWIFHLAQWMAGVWPACAGLAGNPFYRFIHRAILGLAVIGLWPLLRNFRMLSAHELGLAKAGRPALKLAVGFAVGFGSLALVAILAVCFGGRAANLSHTGAEVSRFLLGATTAAIVVAILEELIFRAALFGILRKAFPWPVALVVSSAVYASVHFLQKAPQPEKVDWLSGVVLLPQMFHVPPGGLPVAPAFFTLLVAGAILSAVYQRTGTLFMSIGIHAGWIFWLKSYRFLTREAPGASATWWGSNLLIDGWLPLLVLGCVLLATLRVLPNSAPEAKC